MSADVHQLHPGVTTASIADEAPPLPIEPHIIAAALTTETMRGLTVQMLLVLQHAPRDAAVFDRLHGELLDAWSTLHDHYRAYREVLECRGQA